MKYYKLSIIDKNGSTFDIYGTEEVLKEAYDEIKTNMDPLTGAHRVVEIIGITDTMDRAQSTLAINTEDIQGLYLTGMY